MITYLIVCPLVFFAGMVDAIAGGGGLISLPAYLIAGVPTHMALGTNKLSSAMGATVSTFRFLKGGYIKFKMGVASAAFALVGSGIGARVTLLVEEEILKNLLFFVLPVVAWFVYRNKDMGENAKTGTLPDRQVFAIAVTAAFFIGMYDGFYGPGTGTFLLVIYTGLARMNIQMAAGNTKAVNLASNIAALTTFLINGKVILPLGLAAGAFGILGNYLGSGFVLRKGKNAVRPVILVVLALLFVKIVID